MNVSNNRTSKYMMQIQSQQGELDIYAIIVLGFNTTFSVIAQTSKKISK